jgi:5-methylthioadenosine/S-adenosylhomocysteine deaminase
MLALTSPLSSTTAAAYSRPVASASADPFEADYTSGVLEADPAPAHPADTSVPPPVREFALAGCVLASDRVLERGFVRFGGPLLGAITDTPPSGVELVETDGVILPGLIDLHGHPEYNVFAPWEPPTTYANRGVWRDSPEYAKLVKAPYARFRAADLVPALTRYSEIRALVGGVTAVQGASVGAQVLEEALVRNVDRRIFGQHRGRSIVDLDSVDGKSLQTLQADLASNAIDAIFIHLAEGVDDASRAEFELLKEKGLLVPQVVVIHGTALSDDQLQELAGAGAKLVWSPQSNLRLYAATTQVKRARELTIPVGLGADWVPSGSLSTLDELRVARHQLAFQAAADDPRALVGMVTWDAAAIAGLHGRLGDLQPGMPADVCVLERCHEDPWESVLRSDPSAVQLVTIGGNLVYARTDWYDRLTEDPQGEQVWAWGRRMTLDTTYSVRSGTGAPPRLADLRQAILAADISAGPIFA